MNASHDAQTAESLALEASAAAYGVQFEGTLVGPAYHDTVDYDGMTLRELSDAGGHVSRVRMIGGDYIPGRGKCYDVSYVHGTLPNGQAVSLLLDGLDEWTLIPRRQFKGVFIQWAKNQGVFAKGLGLLDEGNWSVLG